MQGIIDDLHARAKAWLVKKNLYAGQSLRVNQGFQRFSSARRHGEGQARLLTLTTFAVLIAFKSLESNLT